MVAETQASTPATYGSVNIIDALADSMTDAYPDAFAPQTGWSGTSDESEESDAGLPAEADARDDDEDTVAPPETDEPKAAPKKAPAKVSLTEEELQARIEDATRRSRESQKAEAQRATQLERDIARLQKALEARELGLNQLQANYQGTQAEADIMRERQRMVAYTEGELANAERAQAEAANAQQQLVQQKNAVAAPLYGDARVQVVAAFTTLGFSQEDAEAFMQQKAVEDEGVADFITEFNSATDLAAAQRAAQRAYRELVKLGKAEAQARKVAALDADAPDPTKPPTKRTQAHGSHRSGNFDKFENVPFAQRGASRMDEAMAADFARLGIT